MNKYNFNKRAMALLLGGAISFPLSACYNSNSDDEVIQENTTSTNIDFDSASEVCVYDIHGNKLDFIPTNDSSLYDQTYKVSYTKTYSYVTKLDETLKSISMNCDVNISQILNANSQLGIDYSVVNFEDQVLPYGTLLEINYVKEYPYTITESEKERFFSEYYYYIVEDGECLAEVANQSNVSDKVISILNDLDSEIIYPEQRLLLPSTEYSKVYQKVN